MTRLRQHLDGLRTRGERALGLFLTAGFPAPGATLPILRAVDAAGADVVELGMPFSDPVAEGLPIQRASERALAQGATMASTLATAEAFAAGSATPLVLMGYANPVVRYGVAAFCRDAATAGVAGLILPDLPPEEADELDAAAAAHGLAVTYLIAPNTSDDRIRMVAARSTGFVYAVSRAGLTGSGLGDAAATDAYLARARARVPGAPLLVGFGVRTPADAARVAAPTDGAIVGSALIGHAERLWDAPHVGDAARLDALAGYAASLKDALRAPTPGRAPNAT